MKLVAIFIILIFSFGCKNIITVSLADKKSGIITSAIQDNAGITTTFAGAGSPTPSGYLDGIGSAARFRAPSAIAFDKISNNLYVADRSNNVIRKITPSGVVTTLAGTAGLSGSTDGLGGTARFNRPFGIAVDNLGNIYVADTYNYKIRKITSAGSVSTLAGTGASGYADGIGTIAQFRFPMGLAVDSSGSVYVADESSPTIRKITPAGEVSTLAGSNGSYTFADGTGSAARFLSPKAVALDSFENIYVTDADNCIIRKITPAGVVTTFAGTPGANGSTDGIGAAALFEWPYGITIDSSDNIYVTEYNSTTIRKIKSSGEVTTLAGTAFLPGYMDGTGPSVKFSGPTGIAVNSAGALFVVEEVNNTVRKIE
jgi:hypothetical protein